MLPSVAPERRGVGPVQRQVLQVLLLDDLRECPRLGVYNFGVGRHRDRLADAAERQTDVERRGRVDGEPDAELTALREAVGGRIDAVEADRDLREQVRAVRARRDGALECGFKVRERDARIGDRRGARIGDSASERGGRGDLSRGREDHERQRGSKAEHDRTPRKTAGTLSARMRRPSTGSRDSRQEGSSIH